MLHKPLHIISSFSFDPSFIFSMRHFCTDSKAGKEGKPLHDHLIRNGLVSNLQHNTQLIIFYAKIGDLDSARRVFDEMPQRSVVSWTALISGYSRCGCPRKSLELFLAMHRSGFKANEFTYGSVFRSCTGLMCIGSGEQVHGCALKGGLSGNLFVESALVDMYSKCGKIEDARYIFERMLIRDVVCWNAVIGAYAVHGLGYEAFRMFQEMLRDGMVPDHYTFTSTMRACGGVGELDKVNQVHSLVAKLGFGSDYAVAGSLIDAYAKCKNLSTARLLYYSMPKRDLISGTALITGYAQTGSHLGEAVDLFSKINQMDIGMDKVIMCSMLNVCASLASLSLGRQIHAFALKKEPHCDTAMGNALIDMYAKSGEIRDAHHAFNDMKKKNVISWTSLIAGYAKHGYGEEAISLFKSLEDNGLRPNDITFLSLLFACSHTGLISEGLECFNSMVHKYNISPRAEHYSCVIDLLARGGRLQEAYDLICKINAKPSASVWGAMLGACRIYCNKPLGEIAARHLFDLDPENSVNYVVLSNIYASAGLWGNAWHTRKLMQEKSLRKEPGYSLIPSVQRRKPLLLEMH